MASSNMGGGKDERLHGDDYNIRPRFKTILKFSRNLD